MKKLFARLCGKCSVIREFFTFLWENKLWWMMPMIIVLGVIGILILITANNPAAVPFIYTLF